jgi:hypothetical protein
MKPRYKAVVKVIGSPSRLHDGIGVITPCEVGYDLHVGGELIAECEYAKRLSDWAFINGAKEVKSPYDLALSDWEP